MPRDTNVEALEGAVRACCEPHFDRPLKEISLGQVLLRLFQTSRRFNVEIQPQLVLLQKTLLNIEGLGRQLDPDLDLWKTAKPYLEKWMLTQVGWEGLVANMKREAPHLAKMLPQWPRLITQALERAAHGSSQQQDAVHALTGAVERQGRWIKSLVFIALVLVVAMLVEMVWLLPR